MVLLDLCDRNSIYAYGIATYVHALPFIPYLSLTNWLRHCVL